MIGAIPRMFDLSIFATPEAWISLITLIFLEMVLGIDNLVFISITTDRLPDEKQHIGRKLGLAGALVMRVLFLCFASFLVHMTTPLFTLSLGSLNHGLSIRDLVLALGGLYLIYKGIVELRDMLKLTEQKSEAGDTHEERHLIGLPQAVGTIMVMDIVFSIDSVITAVGLANHLIIMIIAVMLAVFVMMAFIDQISNFINRHAEMKILALVFIAVIGVLLVLDGLGINSGIEIEALGMHAEKFMVYFAMIFAIVLEVIQMAYNKNLLVWNRECWEKQTEQRIEQVRAQMQQGIDSMSAESSAAKAPTAGVTPVIIGQNVYVMMPVGDSDAHSIRRLVEGSDSDNLFQPAIQIDDASVEVATIDDSEEVGAED